MEIIHLFSIEFLARSFSLNIPNIEIDKYSYYDTGSVLLIDWEAKQKIVFTCDSVQSFYSQFIDNIINLDDRSIVSDDENYNILITERNSKIEVREVWHSLNSNVVLCESKSNLMAKLINNYSLANKTVIDCNPSFSANTQYLACSNQLTKIINTLKFN